MKKISFTECVDIVGSAVNEYSGVKPYVSTGALDCNQIDFSQVDEVSFGDRPSRANLSAKEGDILFAKMQGTKKTFIVDKVSENYIYSTGFVAVRCKKGVLSQRCLYYLISSDTFLKTKDINCSGATQKAITNAGLKKITISIPDVNTQDALVSVLDLINGVIFKYKQILDKLDGIIQARFVEMFGDPITNPVGWTKYPLGERCEIITGNTPSRADSENYGDFIEWIKSDNINTPYTVLTVAEEYLSEKGAECSRPVEAGSVLMTCIAGSVACIGNVAIADRKVAFNQQINAIVPVEDETIFIYWLMLLSKPFIQSTVNKALKGILSKGKLSTLEFPFPPRSLQESFVTFAKEVDKSKVVIQKSIDKLQLLFDSLIQIYFERC